ncbi:MAG: hypothetical protein WC332_05600 [Clostridia bacterium]
MNRKGYNMDSYYAKVCGISSDFDMKKCSYLFRLKTNNSYLETAFNNQIFCKLEKIYTGV